MRVEVTNATRGNTLAAEGWRASNPWNRLVGLLGRAHLRRGEGLHIVPCSSVHTCFMRFPIDVVYLDRKARVVKTVLALRPFRFSSGGKGVHSVLELPPGTIMATGTAVGDQVVCTDVRTSS